MLKTSSRLYKKIATVLWNGLFPGSCIASARSMTVVLKCHRELVPTTMKRLNGEPGDEKLSHADVKLASGKVLSSKELT